MCRGITEGHVRQAGRAGVTAPEELVAVLGLEDKRCCGRCLANVQRFVELASEGWRELVDSRQLSPAQVS